MWRTIAFRFLTTKKIRRGDIFDAAGEQVFEQIYVRTFERFEVVGTRRGGEALAR